MLYMFQNGEKNADINYNRLKKLCPEQKESDGVMEGHKHIKPVLKQVILNGS